MPKQCPHFNCAVGLSGTVEQSAAHAMDGNRGIDDGQGWRTPQPAGVCDMCTEEKNALAGQHTVQVVNPLVGRLRDVGCAVVYSMRGRTHPITDRLYRTLHTVPPSAADRDTARLELNAALQSFDYDGHDSIPTELDLSQNSPVSDYFRQFPGLDAGPAYNGEGFWELPVPVVKYLEVHNNDVVCWDEQVSPQMQTTLTRQHAPSIPDN